MSVDKLDTRLMRGPAGTIAMKNTDDLVTEETMIARPLPLSPCASEDLGARQATDLGYPSSSTPGSQVPNIESNLFFYDAQFDWSTMLKGSLDATSGVSEAYAEDILGAPQFTQPKGSLSSLPRTASSSTSSGLDSGYQPSRPHSIYSPLNHPATISSSHGVAIDKERNSRCVIPLSQLISGLEKYQIDKLKNLDLILGIVKRVTERLDPLINRLSDFPDAKCLALLHVILNQVVEILEAGCADYLASANEPPNQLLPGLLEAGVYGLDFDGIDLGYKYQERLRSQIVLGVLQPVLEVQQKVLSIAVNSGLDRFGSQQDTDRRLMLLAEKVKERAGVCESQSTS